jgi:hypothetical protein
LEYNSEREKLIIPEYGRNVQNMVKHAVGTADREERNKIADAIIKVMGALFPYLRDVDDYKHKLWDHLFIMSNFELDVDSPYPKPTPEDFAGRPDTIEYPKNDFRYGHYGKSIEDFIKVVSAIEESEEKQKASLQIANLMKRMYLTYNRDSVTDEVIIKQIKELSGGKIELPADTVLVSTSDVIPSTPRTTNTRTKKRTNTGKSNFKKRN